MVKDLIKNIAPPFLIGLYHLSLAFFGAFFYGFPSRKLKVIGITGTNGKSTVVELANDILETAGYKTASLSSIRFKVREKEWINDLKMTMPGRFKLQKFLRKAITAGCQYAVIEVTSEGISQYRHKFINFNVAVFTNLTPEHIETHGGFENYKKAKGELFKIAKGTHIINFDDKSSNYFLNFGAKEKYGYGINWKLKTGNWKFVKATDVKLSTNGIDFKVANAPFQLNLLGGFNVYNALAAICVGLSQGIPLETCKAALEKINVIPGRMELVVSEPFKVFVDYAFTPAALEKVYQILGAERLICVLGAAGGGRDKWKRPVLGELAAKYCQEIIITNEDPYDENPMEIIEQVAKGAEDISVNQRTHQRKSASIYKILDRREAIRKSLELARAGDLVIITGKGCEPWICVEKGRKIPWDDRQVVKEEFAKLNL